jgi:serine protease Do
MTLRLRKKVGERRNAIMLGVISTRMDIPKETVVAMVNGKKIKLSNDDVHMTMGYVHNLTHPLLGGLSNNYLDVYDFDERRKDPTRLYTAKIIVKPVIKALSYRLEGKILRDYKGPASIAMEWQYYYSDDTTKMLGSITTNTSIYRNAPDLNLPVHLLIYEAASDLSANDTLFNYLDRLERTYLTGKYSQPTIIAATSEMTFPSQKEMLRHVSQAVVTILHDEGFGSGVLIDPSGIILTSHHVVIDDTTGLRVRVPGIEDPLPAKIKILNSDYDLALIELPAGQYKSIPLHTRTTLDIGDVVFAIGTPINQTLGQSVTKGIVSGFRTVNGVNFIQTDVSINSGNSGGALVSESGYLMGISTMKAKGRGIEGLGFCIPSATIHQALQFKYK